MVEKDLLILNGLSALDFKRQQTGIQKLPLFFRWLTECRLETTGFTPLKYVFGRNSVSPASSYSSPDAFFTLKTAAENLQSRLRRRSVNAGHTATDKMKI
ncbi:hypothetical protein NPIL_562371 [Nephila pilipes]|uniref:Uncharacterized protein n=1 Tax=Nephila pilipes TaxID=299642 RepID=A0A8X6NJ70_NEPPI|nr:hypothetical protein NPIL_562371 [Nephila pilipes]